MHVTAVLWQSTALNRLTVCVCIIVASFWTNLAIVSQQQSITQHMLFRDQRRNESWNVLKDRLCISDSSWLWKLCLDLDLITWMVSNWEMGEKMWNFFLHGPLKSTWGFILRNIQIQIRCSCLSLMDRNMPHSCHLSGLQLRYSSLGSVFRIFCHQSFVYNISYLWWWTLPFVSVHFKDTW